LSNITGMFCYRYRDDIDMDAYQSEVMRMYERLTSNPDFGFVALHSYSGLEGDNVLVAEFSSYEGLMAWRNDPEHLKVQERARAEWFESYWTAQVVVRATFDRSSGRTELRNEPVSL
jgi:hypothetical protein